MTIEDSIHHLCTWSTTHGSGITTDEQHEQAKKIAIETISKYEKIKKVVAKWKVDDFTGSDGFAWDCMKEIADIVDEVENDKRRKVKRDFSGYVNFSVFTNFCKIILTFIKGEQKWLK